MERSWSVTDSLFQEPVNPRIFARVLVGTQLLLSHHTAAFLLSDLNLGFILRIVHLRSHISKMTPTFPLALLHVRISTDFYQLPHGAFCTPTIRTIQSRGSICRSIQKISCQITSFPGDWNCSRRSTVAERFNKRPESVELEGKFFVLLGDAMSCVHKKAEGASLWDTGRIATCSWCAHT